MKPYISIAVFLSFLLASVWSSIDSYKTTENGIVADMNQALAATLREKADYVITPDTIQTYRSHLNIGQLRENSFICYDMDEENKGKRGLCSDRQTWKSDTHVVAFRSYSTCSFSTIWKLSDQRPTTLFSLLAMIWAAFSFVYYRKRREQMPQNLTTFGALSLCMDNHSFYNKSFERVELTPMQQQLMEMFFLSENHTLTKAEICNVLWPRKEDANETLYALIRRLKPVIERNSRLQINAVRGCGYELQIKS